MNKRHNFLCRRGHDIRVSANRKLCLSGYVQCRQCERDSAKTRRKRLKEKNDAEHGSV